MTKFYRKPMVVSGIQWFQLGDHVAVSQHIVHLYKPEFQWDCLKCGENMAVHGTIETPKGPRTVCPGDWIMDEGDGEWWPYHQKDVEENFDKAGKEN